MGKKLAVENFYEIFIEPLPLSTFFFKYQSRYLTPCCGLEVQKPTQALTSVKGPCITYDLNPKWARTLPLGIVHGIFIEPPLPPQNKFKCQSWYLTPCCGLEVQKPTQPLKSVKGPGITFDLIPKCERTLSPVGNFSWDMYRVRPKKSKCQSWYVTPCCELEVQKPTYALNAHLQ